MNLLKRMFNFLWEGAKEFWDLAEMTERKRINAMIVIALCVIVVVILPEFAWLLALAPVAFIQNMFFTLVSRSRNSQDTDYHRFCAWGSNGVWFICQVMIVKNIWSAIMAGQWWYAVMAGIVYSLATTEGSVLMMKRLIKSEKGKRRVGASDKLEKMENRIAELESYVETARENANFARYGSSVKIMGLTGPPADAISDKEIDAPEKGIEIS